MGHDDLYESLLSRCKEYVLAREDESNPRGTETDHATSWLVRRLRLDLVWEPETEEEQSAFCKKVDPLSLQWEALNLVLASAPTDSDSSSSDSAHWPVPGVVDPQADFASHFTGVEPHGIPTPLTVDASTVRVSFVLVGVAAPVVSLTVRSFLDVVRPVGRDQDPSVPRALPHPHGRCRCCRFGRCEPPPRVVRCRARSPPQCASGSSVLSISLSPLGTHYTDDTREADERPVLTPLSRRSNPSRLWQRSSSSACART